jgi:hypothetical protein
MGWHFIIYVSVVCTFSYMHVVSIHMNIPYLCSISLHKSDLFYALLLTLTILDLPLEVYVPSGVAYSAFLIII